MTGFDQAGFYREIGLRLQLQRKRLDLTQEEVAAGIGVPRATYANVERGRQRVVVDLLWRASVVLRTPIERLVPQPESGIESVSTSTVPQPDSVRSLVEPN